MIAELKAKLAAREGKPGFAANVEAIKAEIARLEAGPWRDKVSGQFVTREYAEANPDKVEMSA